MTLTEAAQAVDTKRNSKPVAPRSFRLTPSVVGTLERLAAARGCSMAQVVRQAVALEALLDGWTEEGGKVLLMDQDGKTNLLVFNRG